RTTLLGGERRQLPKPVPADSHRHLRHSLSGRRDSMPVMPPRVFTIGHGTRSGDDLVAVLQGAGVQTLVDVRRYPGSRRNPQFNLEALAERVTAAGITYVHELELGGRRSGEPGAERFRCIASAAFRSYAARMGTPEWQAALADAVARPAPCFMCAETLW